MPKEGKYAQTLVRAMKKKYQSFAGEGPFVITQEELRAAATEIGFEARNFPDLTYYLRSRAKRLPKALADAGFKSLIITGKGKYTLTKESGKIVLPDEFETRRISTRPIPEAIRDIFRFDEQSILSAVAYVRLLDDFLGYTCHHLQSHLRTTGAGGVQVEADDVFVGDNPQGRVIIPVEGKSPNERLSYSQIRPIIAAVLRRIPGLPVVPIGIKLYPNGTLDVIEFSFTEKRGNIEGIELRRYILYRFDPPLPQWPTAS
ncbi:hypothetical protein MYX82_14240 [Acidobacteria bacterium AH-259-D05]|nr:hypothetical protein [Acidobacteria bacterium AH-259-D05]